MMRKFVGVFIASVFVSVAFSQEAALKRGMIIRKNTKIKKGTYVIDGYEKEEQSAIIIEGNNIVVDFNKAVLKGSAGKTRPDQFFGTGVFVRKGKNITIKNLVAKGYKIAFNAKGIEGLKIENCDFSYNYCQYLTSSFYGVRDDDMSEWLFLNENENDEWLRYGAAIYLKHCGQFTIKDCKVTGGQNALVLNSCNGGRVYNNDFSFNSGIGVSLYRCDNNMFLFNKVNFNIRGYYHNTHYKGQGSAGFLVYEQCNNNTFYKNSATHCGNGLLLNSTPLANYTSVPGSDNHIWGNDFSFAPDVGISIDFTNRSHIYDNRIFECREGLTGEFNYNTVIASNKFRKNKFALSMNCSQHVQIESNIFLEDNVAISIGDNTKRIGYRYGKPVGLHSIDYTIHLNSFNKIPFVYTVSYTDSVRIYNNRYSYIDNMFRIDSTVTNIDSLPVEDVDTAMIFPTVKAPIDPFKGNGRLAGKDKIKVTEWGPYNFQYPFIWHTNPSDSTGNMNFELFGPAGKWKVISTKGIDVAEIRSDSLPSGFIGAPVPGSDIEIILEYKGPAFTDQFGNRIPANKPYRFSYKKTKPKSPGKEIPKGPFLQKM